MKAGIYLIENTATGAIYVGSATNFQGRWAAHRCNLRRGTHASRHLQAAWNRRGEAVFAFRRLLVCSPKDLIFYEQRAIDALRPSYNKCPIAGSTLGRKFSDETLAKMRRPRTAEARARMSASQKGRKQSEATKAKLSAIFKGVKLSPERRAEMSRRLMGHTVTAETRAKLAAAAKGKSPSAEARSKIAATSAGRKHTPQARAKIAAAKLGNRSRSGRPHNPETRAKIKAALLAYWERGRG